MDQTVADQLAGVPVAALAFLILYGGVSKFFYLKQFRNLCCPFRIFLPR